MPISKLQFRPGIVSSITPSSNEGGWQSSNRVRFRYGFPQPIGGWVKYSSETFLGVNRTLHNWITLDGSDLLAVGTTAKYYIEFGGFFYDITPVRSTVTLASVFAATNGSSIITVTDAAHGAITGDFVIITGAASLGGLVTAAVLNAEHEVTVVDANSYTITVSVVADASDTGDGGAATTLTYLINGGVNTTYSGPGWGAGPWGGGGWGVSVAASQTNSLRIWSQDNFGEDLIFNATDGQIYYWDATSGLTARGVTLDSLSSDPTVPTVAKQVLISDKDRHVIAFGVDPGDGTQDPMLIRWSDVENPFIWINEVTNSAGELRCSSGSKIIRAVETKREILVFTDSSLYSLQYIGPPYTYGLTLISAGVPSKGALSHVAVDDAVFWMGKESFYIYDGRVTPLPCPIKEDVFDNMSIVEFDKVVASHNSEFREVTWYFPTSTTEEPTMYVSYNYGENLWTSGNLARTSWVDHGTRQYPIAASADGHLYQHEFGISDGESDPPVCLDPWIESAPVDLGEGDKFMFISRIYPDVMFRQTTAAVPRVMMTVKVKKYAGSNFDDSDPSLVWQTATAPIEQFTEYVDLRLRGGYLVFRIECNTVGVEWTLGSPKLEIRPDGRR